MLTDGAVAVARAPAVRAFFAAGIVLPVLSMGAAFSRVFGEVSGFVVLRFELEANRIVCRVE